MKIKMKIAHIIILCLLTIQSYICELIVDSYDKVTPELLEAKAKLVKTVEEYPDPLCEDIKEVHKTYEVILKNGEIEERDTFNTIAMVENGSIYVKNHINTIPLYFRKLLNCYEQDNPKLIQNLRENYIEPPSVEPHEIPEISEIVAGRGYISADNLGEKSVAFCDPI